MCFSGIIREKLIIFILGTDINQGETELQHSLMRPNSILRGR